MDNSSTSCIFVFERPLLDERFLNKPGFAIEQCKSLNHKMADLAKNKYKWTIAARLAFLDVPTLETSAVIHVSVKLLNEYQEKEADKLNTQEEMIDHYEDVLGTFLLKALSVLPVLSLLFQRQ